MKINIFFLLLFSHILGQEHCPELSAHPSSKSSYIQMVHGISIRRECPPSTIYYQELCRCDHIAKGNVGGNIQITQTGPNINTQLYNTVQSPGQQNQFAIIVKPKQQNDVPARKKTMWVPVARNPKPVISSNNNNGVNGGTAKQRHDDAHQALLDILNGGKANKPSIRLGTNVGSPISHMVGSSNYMMQTIPTTPSSFIFRTLLPTTPRPIEIRVRPGAGKGTRIDATKPTMTLTNYVRPYSLTRQETFVQQPPEPKPYSIRIQEPIAIIEQDPITPQSQQSNIQSKTAYYGRRPHESIQNQNKPQTYEWKTIQNDKTPEALRNQQKQIPSYDRGTSYVLRTQTDQRTKAELLQPLSPELPSQQISISGGTESYDGYSRNKKQNLEDILRNIVIKVTPSPVIDSVQTTARNRRYREYGNYRSRYRIQQQEPQTTPQPIIYEQTTPVKERKHYRQYGEYHSRYRIQQQEPPTTPPPIIYEQTTQVKERKHYRQYGEYHSRYRIQQLDPLTTPPPIVKEQTTKRQERQPQQQYVEYQSGYRIQQLEPPTTPPPLIYEQTTKRQERQPQQQYVEYQSGYRIQQQEPPTTPPPLIYEQTTKRQERQPQQQYVEYQSGYRIQQQEPPTTPPPLIYEQTTKRQERQPQQQYVEYQSGYRIQQQEPPTTPPPLIYEQTTKRQERQPQQQYVEYQSGYRIQQQEPPTTQPSLIFDQTTTMQELRRNRQYGEYQSLFRIQQQEPTTTPPPIIYEQSTQRQQRKRNRQYGEYQPGYRIQQKEPQTTLPPLIFDSTIPVQQLKRNRQYGEYQSQYGIQQEQTTTRQQVPYEQTTTMPEPIRQQQYVEYQSQYRIQQQEPQPTAPPLIFDPTTPVQELKRNRQYGEYQSQYDIQQQEPQTTPPPIVYEQITQRQQRKRNRQYDEYNSQYRIQQQEPKPTAPPLIFDPTTPVQELKRNRQYGEYQSQYGIQLQEPTTTPQPILYEQTTKMPEPKRQQQYGEYQSQYRIQQQQSQPTAPSLVFDPTTPVQELKRNRQYGEYQSQYDIQQQEPQTTPPPIVYEQITQREQRNRQNGEYNSQYRIQQQEPKPTAPPLIFDPTTPVQELKLNQQYGEYQSQYGIQQQEPQTTPPPIVYEQITQRQRRTRNQQYGEYKPRYRPQQQEPSTTQTLAIYEQTTPVQDLPRYQQYGEYQSQYQNQNQEPTTPPPLVYEQTTQRQQRRRVRQYGEYQSRYPKELQQPQTTLPSIIYEQATQGQEPERYQEYRFNFITTTTPAPSNLQKNIQRADNNQSGRLQLRQGQPQKVSNGNTNYQISQSTRELSVMQNSYQDMNLFTEIVPTDGFVNTNVNPQINPDTQMQYQSETINALPSEYAIQRHADQNQPYRNTGADQSLSSNNPTRIPPQEQRPIAQDQYSYISDPVPQSQNNLRQSSNDPEIDIQRRPRRRRIRPKGISPRYRHQQGLGQTDQAANDDRRLNTSRSFNSGPADTRQNANLENKPIVRVQTEYGPPQNQIPLNSYSQSNVETSQNANSPSFTEYGQYSPPSNKNENIQSQGNGGVNYAANQHFNPEPVYIQTTNIYEAATEPPPIRNAAYSQTNGQQPRPQVQYATNPDPVPDPNRYSQYQPENIMDPSNQPNQQIQYVQNVLEPVSISQPQTEPGTGLQSSGGEYGSNRGLPIGSQGQSERSINRFRIGIRPNTDGNSPGTIVSHSDGYAVSVSGTDSSLQVLAKQEQRNSQPLTQQSQFQRDPTQQLNQPYGSANIFEVSQSKPLKEQGQAGVVNQNSNTFRVLRDPYVQRVISAKEQNVAQGPEQTSYRKQSLINHQIHGNAPQNQNTIPKIVRIQTKRNKTDRFAFIQPQPSPSPPSPPKLSDYVRSSNPSSNTYTIQISHNAANENSKRFPAIDFSHDTSFRTGRIQEVSNRQTNLNSNINIQDVQRPAIGTPRENNNRLHINSYPSQMMVVNPTVNPVQTFQQAPAQQPIFGPSILANPTAPPAPTPRSWTNNRINTGLPNPPRQGYETYNSPTHQIQINQRTIPSPKVQTVSRKVTIIQQNQGSNTNIGTQGTSGSYSRQMRIVVPKQVIRQAVQIVNPTLGTHQASPLGPAPGPTQGPTQVPAQAHAPPHAGPPVWKPDPNVHWRTNIAAMEAADVPDMQAVSFINHLLAKQPGLSQMDRFFLQELVA